MPPNIQLVQAAHAAMEVGFQCEAPSSPTHFVVLGVKDQDELLYYKWLIQREDVELHIFHEPDDDLGFTALCTYPKEGKIRCLRNLKLLR